MSNVNIKRAVENIKSGTTVYTPVAEVIVNAIQAIKSKNEKNGEITISVSRCGQTDADGSTPAVESFEIKDNGIGFTDENRQSFDTLYTDQKIKEGGKGFGRFTCLKYFEDMSVESVYENGGIFNSRTFFMGKNNDIIVDEQIGSSYSTNSGSIIRLLSVKEGKFTDKRLETIAKNLVEKLLPYFISEDFSCPKIIINDKGSTASIELNDYVNNQLSDGIKEIIVPDNKFSLNGNSSEYDFNVRVFKFYSPKKQRSKVSLVAHQREVTNTAIHNHIPEFIEEFYEKNSVGSADSDRNYIIRVYVFGGYLDNNVSLERGGFEFQKENDVFYGVSQNEIEVAALAIAKNAVGNDITARQEKKKQRVNLYVEEQAPWHKRLLKGIDLSDMPYNPDNETIESTLQKEKYHQEIAIKREISQLLADSDVENLKANITEIVQKISGTSQNDLIHYIALRRNVLDIFKRSLELNPDGSYSSEGIVHDIIFPRKGDNEKTLFENHNLWIIESV